MKKKQSIKKILLLLCSCIIVIYFIIVGTDYTLSLLNKKPLFAKFEMGLTDGGTSFYDGLGYKVTVWRPLDGKHWVDFKMFK